jgi:hypothetical protein
MSQRAGAAPAEPRGLERGQLAQPWSRSDLAGPLRGARRGGLLVGVSVENSDEQRASEKSLAPG